MKIPLSWLKDYVDINVPVEDLAERLTLAGLEVESIEYIGLAPQRKSATLPGLAWDRDKIVVAAVLEVKPHPNADRLVLADVATEGSGAAEPHTVVTGAPNLFEYKGLGRLAKPLKVVYAKTGAVLYDGHQAGRVLATLKPTKIRGVPSDAMVCSEKELGISDEHEGIMFLPDDAPVGMPLADYMGDAVLDFDIKGSFGHLQNVTGIAREAAALLNVPMKRAMLTILDRKPVTVVEQADFIELEIAAPDLCPRYSAALIKGVKIGPSPFWMQQRLARAGMRPINNIVDITNYVMLELGQPLHAFDYHRLSPRCTGGIGGGLPAIIVRRAKQGETMTTLDGQLRQLDPQMLLITDGGGPVAIAGVMGGLESEVTDSTTDILLESANFHFLNNRRTSQLLGLKSEASMRFGKRIDPELTLKALARAGQLMEQLASGRVEPVYGDVYPGKREPVVITLDPVYVNRLLGIEMPVDEMTRILTSLEFKVEAASKLCVTVPSHRLDVSLPADLAEEIARMYGYDRFPSTLLRDELPPQRDNPRLDGADRVRDVLAGCGLDEIITYSMTTEAREALLGVKDERPYLHVVNPIAADKTAMRHTALASALDTVASNLRFTERVTVFEIGAVYLPREGQPLPDEPRRLSIVMTGPREDENWQGSDRKPLDFWDIKGVVQVLVERLRLQEARYEPADPAAAATYHAGRAANLMIGEKKIGVFGELYPPVRNAFDLPDQPVCAAEFDLEALIEAALQAHTCQNISRFPAVHEDIAVVVDEAVSAAQVEATIWNAGRTQSVLREVRLFDLYRGEQIGAGRKSLAYRLTYQADDRTLTDDDAAKVRAKIVKALERELNGTLRASSRT